MAAAKTSRILSKTLSTLNEHRNHARQQRSHSQPAIQIHSSLTEEFGSQLDFHTQQADELRVKSREVETLRGHLKKLRAAAEDVAHEYERLGDRTSKMNTSLSSLLSHLLEQPSPSAGSNHPTHHRLSAALVGTPPPEVLKSSADPIDNTAASLPPRTSFVTITDFDIAAAASPRDTPSPTPSASSVAMRFRHRRRSKEALMKAIRAYVHDDGDSALEEDDDDADAEMSAFVGDPNTSWSFFDSERGPLQKGSSASGMGVQGGRIVHGEDPSRTPSPTAAAATASIEQQNQQQHLDSEVLTHLMLVVHEMQQYLVQACQQTHVHLSAEFTARLTDFIKGDIRTVRYTSQEYFKSLNEYQSCLKSLNQMAANAHGGDASENDPPSGENERGGNLASMRLAQLRNTVQRMRTSNEISEAKRYQHVRASTVTASENLQTIGEHCLVHLDLTEAALEVTTLPQTLVSYIKTLRNLFENGIKKCDGLLSAAELDSIDALLMKRHKESLATRKSKQVFRRQASEEAITLKGTKRSSSLAAKNRNSLHIKVEDAIQSFANASLSSPKGPPPLPPKRKDVDNRSPSQPPPSPPSSGERKTAAGSPPLPSPPVPSSAKPFAKKTESPMETRGLVEQRRMQLNADHSTAIPPSTTTLADKPTVSFLHVSR